MTHGEFHILKDELQAEGERIGYSGISKRVVSKATDFLKQAYCRQNECMPATGKELSDLAFKILDLKNTCFTGKNERIVVDRVANTIINGLSLMEEAV